MLLVDMLYDALDGANRIERILIVLEMELVV
jgi:hypothetical protein